MILKKRWKLNKKVDLIRIVSNDKGTIGILVINNELFCNTLELPWKNNERQISCIPAGTYTCKRWYSPSFGWTYLVLDVPNRSYIEFHTGNTIKDTKGCILLGKYSYTKGTYPLVISGITFNNFILIMEEEPYFLLTIKSCII